MTDEDIKTCQERLLEMKSELENDIYGEHNEALGVNAKESSGDLSSHPLHTADIGTDNYNRDFNLDIAETKSRLLYIVNNAILKIKNNDNYGHCEACNTIIHKERLFLVPYVRLCVTCQENKENSRSNRNRKSKRTKEERIRK